MTVRAASAAAARASFRIASGSRASAPVSSLGEAPWRSLSVIAATTKALTAVQRDRDAKAARAWASRPSEAARITAWKSSNSSVRLCPDTSLTASADFPACSSSARMAAAVALDASMSPDIAWVTEMVARLPGEVSVMKPDCRSRTAS